MSVLSTAITAAILAAPLLAQAGEFRNTQNPVPGQYIVVLKQGAAKMANENSRAASVGQIGRQIAAEHRADVIASFDNVLRGFAVKADDAALAKLLADPRVEYVEEDGYVSINATQTGATWGLDRVDQRNLPLNTTYVYNKTGAGVHAYIIDTGILTTHTQFTGRIGAGFDAVGGGVTDCNGHGTHVAGTVGGTTWGVAKSVILHPVRVLGCTGSGTWTGVISGMNWVAANRIRPAVANMSLGGGINTSVDAAVQTMVNAGVTVVVAAGNSNTNACNFSPARAPAAITVGSTERTDARSSFSNYGTCLDIFAPGGSITSAWYTSTTASNTISGTSMASPHVAGAAALYLQTNPAATPAAVTNAIIGTSTPNKVTGLPATPASPNRLLYTLSL
ncbi:MAG: S8 family peptidase [Lysobacteraceae bacterium]|nr:MAG: S8 family peptidase [Xanthomonadaceae bacterium]